MLLILSIFKWILASSILGSILACLILLFKFFTKNKISIRWQYFIWLLLIVRLVIPYAPQSPISIFNLFYLNENKHVQTTNMSYTSVLHTITDNSAPLTSQSVISVSPVKNISPSTQENQTPQKVTDKITLWMDLISLLWLAGVLSLTVYTIGVTIYFNSRLKYQPVCKDKDILELLELCKKKLRLNRNITIITTNITKSPSIFGFIKPKLLLPSDITNAVTYEELQFIILHELSHLKRKDIEVSCLVCILRILHWFNPILWYSFYKMNEDKELACDSLVLSNIMPNDCLKYGETILKLVQFYSIPTSICGMASIFTNKNKSQLKRRINMISLFKKNAYKFTVISILAIVLIASIFLTNPINNSVYASSTTKNTTVPKQISSKPTTSNIEQYEVQARKFKGSLLIIHDPKKIAVGYSKETAATSKIAKNNNAIAAINAGGFSVGKGNNIEPAGLLIHDGKIIHSDYKNSSDSQSLVGFNSEGVLLVGNYTLSEIQQAGIKEAVSFGPPLIVNGKALIKDHTQTGIAPRTAIGQKADGSVIFLVIDGRSLDSVGATLQDVQDIMLKYGAVNAANLDGGSSSTMYYNRNIINHPSDSSGERQVPSIFMVLP